MKKIFILTVFSFITFASIAQLQIGPKAGINLFRQGLSEQGGQVYSASFVPGFNAGIGLEYSFGGRFSLALDALYSQKGSFLQSKVPVQFADVNIPVFHEFQDRLNYLNFPLYLKYYLRGKDFGMNLQAGIELGFLMSASQSKGKYTNPSDVIDIIEIQKSDYNIGDGPFDTYLSSDFGLVLGAGFFYEMDSGRIIADLQYHHGTSNIINTSLESQERSNRGISFSVGYMFPLGGGF
jgi:hypothetical protein